MESGVEEIPYSQFRARLLDNSRIRQLADCQLADWTTRGLGISRTGQLAYWTSRGLDNSRMHLRVRELSSPRLVQSACWQSASWTSAQLWDRGTERCSGETGFSTQPYICFVSRSWMLFCDRNYGPTLWKYDLCPLLYSSEWSDFAMRQIFTFR